MIIMIIVLHVIHCMYYTTCVEKPHVYTYMYMLYIDVVPLPCDSVHVTLPHVMSGNHSNGFLFIHLVWLKLISKYSHIVRRGREFV